MLVRKNLCTKHNYKYTFSCSIDKRLILNNYNYFYYAIFNLNNFGIVKNYESIDSILVKE